MAGNSTISITFKLEGDAKGFKDLANDAEGLKKAITSTVTQAQGLNTSALNFAAIATGIDAAQRSLTQLQSSLKDLSDAYAVQEMAETRLATVMAQRMGASEADIQGIKDLASAQQELGVIGDEVQLSGAQQMATFLTQRQSLETLLPAMNNLLAQQKGLSATTMDAANVGNLMGKVMQGQTAALTRVGITFSDAEEKVLKFGTEQERAAMLAQIITNNVGQMNAALAQTESGQQQQLVNTLGDLKEELGAMVNGALPFVTMAAQASTAVGAVSTLIAGVKALSVSIYDNVKAMVVSTAAYLKNNAATLAATVAQKAVAAATAVWRGAQAALNFVLSANPIGAVVMAIAALVSGVVWAYKNCEAFRNVVDRVWQGIKPLASTIMNGLAKAFGWLSEKVAEAWNWLRKVLGLAGQTVTVTAEVKPVVATEPTLDMGDLLKKYETAGGKSGTTKGASAKGKTTKKAPTWQANAETLEGIEGNLDFLGEKLKKASAAEAATINRDIAAWQAKADAIRNAGKAVPEWKADASTLDEITANLDILGEKLKKASAAEAATINRDIAAWQAKADAIRNAGKETPNNAPVWRAEAATLAEIADNVAILNKQLQTASLDEAAAINQQIAAWREKEEAIRNAGKAAEKTGRSVGKAFAEGWGGLKGIGSGIDGLSEAIEGNGSAWQALTGIVDSVMGILQSVQTVFRTLTTATQAETAATLAGGAAKQGLAAATTTATAASAAQAAASLTAATAAGTEAAADTTAAAAKTMKAHAWMPFVGIGIAGAMVGALIATIASAKSKVPKFAAGGIVSGPTLALVGEYGGAANNPEVIAPLDKLRAMIQPATAPGGRVEFEIKGRSLVGILQREAHRDARR